MFPAKKIFSVLILSVGILFFAFSFLKSSPYRLLRPYPFFGRILPEKYRASTKMINGRKTVLIPSDGNTAPFFIDQIPVTINDYLECVAEGRCAAAHYRGEYEKYIRSVFYVVFPVTFVTWHEARTYCQNNGGDLPSNEQWTAAAGNGTYAWGDSFPTAAKANIDGWYQSHTPAGWLPKGASPYGVLDLNGNIREWILDGNENGEKGLKGGNFQDSWSSSKNESIIYHDPYSPGFNRGFRCAYEYQEEN